MVGEDKGGKNKELLILGEVIASALEYNHRLYTCVGNLNAHALEFLGIENMHTFQIDHFGS